MRNPLWSALVMALVLGAVPTGPVRAAEPAAEVSYEPGYEPQEALEAEDSVTTAESLEPAPDSGEYYPPGSGDSPASGDYCPPGSEVQPAGYGGGYAIDPDFAGGGPIYPNPEISPFEHSFDQTYWMDGLWYGRTNNRRRRHFFEMDYWSAVLKGPNAKTLVGAPVNNNLSAWAYAARVGTETFFSFDIDNPDRAFREAHRLHAFKDDNNRVGIITRLGYIDPDDTGLELRGFWTAERTAGQAFRRGSIDRIADPGLPEPSIRNVAQVLFVPALNSLEAPADAGRLTYNDGFLVSYLNQSFGGELNLFASTPITVNQKLRISGLLGGRYMHIHNRFNVVGVDGELDRAIGPLLTHPAYTMTLENDVRSDMFGPQIGVSMDMGGDTFKLTAHAKVAGMANVEKIRLNADNYGLIITGSPRDIHTQENDVTFVPLYEVGLTSQMRVFQYLPGINRIPVVRQGLLKVGYDFVEAGEIAQSEQSIQYYHPLPKINVKRDKFNIRGFTVGTEFRW